MNGWMRRSEVKSGGNDRLYHLGQGRRKEGLWNSEEQFFVHFNSRSIPTGTQKTRARVLTVPIIVDIYS